VVGPLPPHIAGGQPAQFVINQRQELRCRVRAPALNSISIRVTSPCDPSLTRTPGSRKAVILFSPPGNYDQPDGNFSGFDFWLNKLNSFSQPGEDMRDPQQAQSRVVRAEMVTAFISSTEYRQRFGKP
jgi:hypothetical protein